MEYMYLFIYFEKLGKLLPGPVVNITGNITIESPFERQKFVITTIVVSIFIYICINYYFFLYS